MKLGNEIIKDGTDTLIYIGEMKSKSQVDDVLLCAMIQEEMSEERKAKIMAAAQLAESAPDLLEALRALIAYHELHYCDQPIELTMAKEAINKALNTQP